MTAIAFSPPKHWEDWAGVLLGIWLCVSPWVLGFAGDDMTATQNAVLIGALLILAEMVILMAFRTWEEWVNVILGLWLVISPWALTVAATPLVAVDFVVVGLVVLGLAFYEMWDEQHHAHPA
ncbi:MAG: SPW repeat protein [Proteobacteria bacterium]|nr:SPW repeat protein [Pseudomonadota bacterium]